MNFIEEADITSVSLSIELERAVVNHTMNPDGSLYVIDDSNLGFWCVIREPSSLINLTTYVNFRSSTTVLQRLTLANDINRTAYGVTSWNAEGQLRLEHVLSYRGGLLRETFVRGVRSFGAVITKALRQFDPDYEILVPVSETESISDDKPAEA